ncbi:hypothetical protein IMZ48_10070 [Candidatus Bathyarchaeota archaeon]|nr:hypothetical protein [Candidatus Bathyarchaeota archaeon]
MSDPAPKRRLPFKRTALRKEKSDAALAPASGDGEEDGLALFRRSTQMLSMMTADAERRAKREREKDETRKRRGETAERGQESQPGSAQKRRASECEGIKEEEGFSTPTR